MSTTEDLFAGGESDCPGRDGSWKLWLRRAGAAGALALFAAVSAGQEEAPAAISEQLWANIILGYPKSAHPATRRASETGPSSSWRSTTTSYRWTARCTSSGTWSFSSQ
jgi:hypothetical protein